jgi:hypothetical protein
MRLSPMLAIALVAATAHAHVGPSVGDNNRYLKVTPLGDRVRLSYTVFYGQIPGAKLRRMIDAGRDGAIDDTETRAFGDRVAREIAAALEVTVDSARRPVAWSQVVVGMGTPKTAAGAFSIDLVAWFCLAPPRGTHTMLLRDRLSLDNPGETEVKVEDSPGVKVDHARIGADAHLGIEYKIIGAGGPLEDDGLDVQFTAGDNAVVTSDAVCERAAPRRDIPTGVIVGAAAVTAFALAGIATLVRRRRARRARPRRQ